MSDIKKELQKLVEKFNLSKSEKKDKVKDLERTIVIIFDNGEAYHTELKDGKLSDIQDGKVEGDITVSTDVDTFKKILNGDEDALTAYITKRIKVKAKLMDKLLLAEILK